MRTAKRVKKTKEVKTHHKKKIVENVAGLPVLPLPDGVLSTGSSAKLEKGKQVKKVKKGKMVKELKKGKEVKNVKKGRLADSGPVPTFRGVARRSRTYLRSRGSLAQTLVH